MQMCPSWKLRFAKHGRTLKTNRRNRSLTFSIEVEEGAEGPHDLKATLAEFDDFSLTNYALGDFHYRRIGADGMLVRYKLEYAATLAGEAIHSKSIIGEVWEKTAGDWKLFYFQETKIK